MNNLSAFLAENAIKQENEKHVVSNRFVQDGKPIEWEIRAVTSQEDEEIRKNCTKNVQVPGKKNQYTTKMDQNKYIASLAVACTVFPNLNDAQLQDSYGVMGADELLKAMLLPGEYADYAQVVVAINGFDKDLEDKVDEAKKLINGGDYESNIAYYCLHKFNKFPSEYDNLPINEKAFVIAAIQIKLENDKKKEKEAAKKARRRR